MSGYVVDGGTTDSVGTMASRPAKSWTNCDLEIIKRSLLIYGPPREKTCLWGGANNKGPDL